MTYTTLRDAGALVRRKQEFTGNNIYGRWYDDGKGVHSWYVVFSYGDHFPMYIFDTTAGLWFGNADKYSRTTSRHQSACHPPHIEEWYNTDRMRHLARSGMAGDTLERLRAEAEVRNYAYG